MNKVTYSCWALAISLTAGCGTSMADGHRRDEELASAPPLLHRMLLLRWCAPCNALMVRHAMIGREPTPAEG